MLVKKKQAPRQGKTKSEYLLQGKVYCAKCGSLMICESGKSHTGKTYCYYACEKKKKTHNCNKKNERRETLEEKVLKATENYVFNEMYQEKYIDNLVIEYNKFNPSDLIAENEKRYKYLDAKHTKLTNAFVESEPKSRNREKIKQDLATLEAEMINIENQIEMLKSSNTIMTKDKIKEIFKDI